MTWFNIFKISLIDEVLQYWGEQGELEIEYHPMRYGPSNHDGRKKFYLNDKSDLGSLRYNFSTRGQRGNEKYSHIEMIRGDDIWTDSIVIRKR